MSRPGGCLLLPYIHSAVASQADKKEGGQQIEIEGG